MILCDITHGHVTIGPKTITSPSYLVLVSEEDRIAFNPVSSLSNAEHPERVVAHKETAEEVEEKARKKDKEKEAKKKGAKPKKTATKKKEAKKPEAKEESKK